MAGIPQVITEDRASGAQFIEGSLKFDGGYLTRTPSSVGNRRTFTWSAWIKRSDVSSRSAIWGAGTTNGSGNPGGSMYFNSSTGTLQVVNGGGTVFSHVTSASHKDTGWYHVVIATNTAGTPRVAIYINGERATASGTIASQDFELDYNNTIIHAIGSRTDDGALPASIFKGHMSQVYLIDGQALGPEEFGYTDPLTNTWRPKKYTGAFTKSSPNNGTNWTQSLSATSGSLSNGANAFDGDLSTRAQTANAAAGKELTFAPPAINFTTSLEVYCDQGSAVPTATWNGNTVNPGGGAWVTVYSGSGELSSTYPLVINTETAAQYATLKGVRIDGEILIDNLNDSGVNSFYLPMDGNTPIGEDQSGIIFPNDGTIWSNFSSDPNGVKNSGNADQLFNGNLSSGGIVLNQRSTSNTAYYVALDGVSIPCNNSVACWMANGASTATMRINGDDNLKVAATSTTNAWVTLNFTGTITKIELGYLDGSGSSNTYYGIQVDGHTLIDGQKGNDWTPVGFGGSVELPKATGAIPVLNTNDAGTVAKGGVRTDSKTYTVTTSAGNYYIDGALKPTLNAYRGGSYIFDYTGATSHPFYLSSLPDGKHNSKAYSVEFDGSNQYLTHPNDNTITDWSSGDYTIELWAYFDSFAVGANNNTHLIGAAAIDSGSESWSLGPNASGQVQWYYWNGSQQRVTGGTITTGRWYHLAMTHSGGAIRIFIDGNLSTTGSVNGTPQASTLPLRIGKITNSSSFDGYVSNVRIVRGSAVYTSNFTPSQTTLTNITNTTFLACQDSDATTAPVAPGTITATGAAASQTRQPFLYDNNHGNFGVNTGTSNTTKITIPHLAADTLYYYCNAHSGMGSSINVTTDIFKADPYAWKCMFAMASDTVDHSPEINVNSTASSFGDIHTTTLQRSRNLYGHSKKMETGGGFRIDIELTTAEANAKHQWGTGDFTVECWHYQDGQTTSWHSLFRSGSYNNATLNSIGIAHYANGQTLFPYWGTGGGAGNWGQTGNVVPYKKWHHTAWTRQGGVNRIFANGVIVKTFNDSRSYDNKGFEIGDVYTWNGGYQDARIYNGVAKYTENFIVPATEPDILPDTPSGITGKTNLTKITEGAVSFDGNGDYLSLPSTSDFDFGTGDFTCELFFRCTDYSNTPYLFDFRTTGGAESGSYVIYVHSNGTIIFWHDGSSRVTSNNKITLNAWVHLAVVRSSGITKMYVDGVAQTSSYSDSNDYGNGGRPLYIGVRRSSGSALASQSWNGQLSNVRVLKGTALYTSNFTPPTRELTEVTNTKLLCCQSPTSASTAAVSPANEPFSGAGGAEGGGTTSDYLQVSSSGHSDFSVDGDFTFEWWHYRAATNVNNGFMWTIGDSKTSTGLELYWGSSGSVLRLYTNNGPNTVTATAATGWHHYAVVRSGNTIKVYYDGTEGGSFTNTNTFSGDVRIGAEYYNSTITGGMNGPMSQFRFVKGTAVYTSNFTAPTTALTAITNTKLLTLQGSTITDASGTSKTITVNGTVTTIGISKNGNAAATNFNPFTDDINAIRGQEGGYATLNPLALGNNITLSEGNLKASEASSSGHTWAKSNIGVTSGKWYVEIAVDSATGPNSIGLTNFPNPHTGWIGTNGSAVNQFNIIYNNATTRQIFDANVATTNNISGAQWSVGDVLQIAYDADAGKAWFGINNTWYQANGTPTPLGDVTSGNNATFVSFLYDSEYFFTTDHHDAAFTYNFGQKPFKFLPPDGFQPLNLSNVQPEKVIARPDQYVDIATWTGDGTNGSGTSNDRQVTGLGHKPDLVWCKIRTQDYTHVLWDSVRGPGVNKELQPNEPNQEGSANTAVSGYISEFTSDGFKTVTGTTDNDYFDRLNDTYVAWCWKAGGNKNTFNIDDVGYANASDVNMSVGSLNSSVYNQSSVWTNDLTGTPYGSQTLSRLFDGTTSTGLIPNNGTSITFSPTGFSSISKLRIYGYSYSGNANGIRVNGNDYTNLFSTGGNYSGSSKWVTIPETHLSSVEWSINSNGIENGHLGGIEVDGKLLVDSGVTAANVPSIAATGCSVGTKQGFSIITYSVSSNSTVSHGLTQAPEFGIFKCTTEDSSNWGVYYTVNGNNANWMSLNNTNAQGSGVDFVKFYDKYVQIASNSFAGQGNAGVGYMWHSVPGLQKFGTYSGNGSGARGPFVELGFRPAIIWIKDLSAADSYPTYKSWVIYDSKRPGYNVENGSVLYANMNNGEGVRGDGGADSYAENFVITSNGFAVQHAASSWNVETNENGRTYLYCAWAEAPNMNLYGAQSNAF